MQNKLFEAVETFFKDYVECDIKEGKNSPSNSLTAHIQILHNKNNLDIYFKATSSLLKSIAKKYMHESLDDEASIKDFFAELSNIITGMTKVNMEEDDKNIEFKLSTPSIVNKTPRLSSKKVYKIFNKCFMVGIK